MRTVLSLLLLISPALAQRVDPTPAPATKADVERSVALCDNPKLTLRKAACDKLRERLKGMK